MQLFQLLELQTLSLVTDDGRPPFQPYIWPAAVWLDGAAANAIPKVTTTPAGAGATTPYVLSDSLGYGGSVAIPQFLSNFIDVSDDTYATRDLILIIVIFDRQQTPFQAVMAGYDAFLSTLQAQFSNGENLLNLSAAATRDATINAITNAVQTAVTAAVKHALTVPQKVEIGLGLLTVDAQLGSNYLYLSNSAVGPNGLPIDLDVVLPVAQQENPAWPLSRQLVSYGDTGSTGNVNVFSPLVVGNGGWEDFQFIFTGQNELGQNCIYAVNGNGQLLSYGDSGTADNVSDPVTVGSGGWLEFFFLFGGRNDTGQNRIYAVDNVSGQLLSYVDHGTPGNVQGPTVVGSSGWLNFKFLFAGQNQLGQNRIYGVDRSGSLLTYSDNGTTRNLDGTTPVVVGSGSWLNFVFMFAGQNELAQNCVYGADVNGLLLCYGDNGTTGNVNVAAAVVVGDGYWLESEGLDPPPYAFRFLFAGRNRVPANRIYGVNSAPVRFRIHGTLSSPPFEAGQLWSYAVQGMPGSLSVPEVIGYGGWSSLKCLFVGQNGQGDNRIYAVNQSGELLSYSDDGTPGNVAGPTVVGLAGWLEFKFLFAGQNELGQNRIYAVDASGKLRSYGDNGMVGNVSSFNIVGSGAWLEYKALFAGPNELGGNRIYAVDAAGRLLSYGDNGSAGNVANPNVVGYGGWQGFSSLFVSQDEIGENRIYGVDSNGRLLSYADNGNLGNVSSPLVLASGGWGPPDFQFVFGGQNATGVPRIYAVIPLLPPTPPTGVNATYSSIGAPLLAFWSYDASELRSVAGFRVTATGPIAVQTEVGQGSLWAAFDNLQPGVYHVTVVAFNAAGSSAPATSPSVGYDAF